MCRLIEPPEECLAGTEATWVWSIGRKFWIAKIVQARLVRKMIIAGCKYGKSCSNGEGRRCLSATKCSVCSFGQCFQHAKAENAAGLAFSDSGSCKMCSSAQLDELVSDNGWGVYSRNGTVGTKMTQISTVAPMKKMNENEIKKVLGIVFEDLKLKDIEHGGNISRIVVLIVLLSFFAMSLLHIAKSKTAHSKALLECTEVGFTVVCSILAAHMTITQVSRYLENKDTSSISYKRFNHLEEDKYPTFSICLSGYEILWNDEFIFKDLGISPKNLERILKGDQAIKYQYNRKIRLYDKLQLNADHNTISDPHRFHRLATEFFSGLEFRTEDPASSIRFGEGTIGQPMKEIPFYIGLQTPETICFTRQSNDSLNSIRTLDRVTFMPDIFGNRIYSYVEMQIFIHYPGQLMRSFHKPLIKTTVGGTRITNVKTDPENFWDKILRIKVSEITVLKQRPDSNVPCNEELQDDDYQFQLEITKLLDCIPTYWKHMKNKHTQWDYCVNSIQYQNASRYIQEYQDILSSYAPPCVDMSILALHDGVESKDGNDPRMEIIYPERFYQEIRNTRSFGFEGFLSGVGGFVGIFLGYSLLQLPSLLYNLFEFFRKFKNALFKNDAIAKQDGKGEIKAKTTDQVMNDSRLPNNSAYGKENSKNDQKAQMLHDQKVAPCCDSTIIQYNSSSHGCSFRQVVKSAKYSKDSYLDDDRDKN